MYSDPMNHLHVRAKLPTQIILLLITWLAVLSVGQARQGEPQVITSDDDIDFHLSRFAADGEHLLLWIAPEYGWREAHHALASELAEQGIEVWQVDLLGDLFLPHDTVSQRQLDGRYLAMLAARVHDLSGKRIALVGDAYAAVTVLRAARLLQPGQPASAWLTGAILFTPATYASIPPLGQAPEFLPVVEASNIPIMIYQSHNSLTTVTLDNLLERLQGHGAPVYRQHLAEVNGLFYDSQAGPATRQATSRVVSTLPRILPLLASHALPRQAPPLPRQAEAGDSGIDIYLKAYRGAIKPSRLDLLDAHGRRFVRDDFSGRITLINFWATWCPPCVEEIPSLNRLKMAMQDEPFELISIDYAESAETVREFMRRVEVDFPVLLDEQGDYARRWNVITYPSTFVLDTQGRIRYGVNAAIDWDDPAVIERLRELMPARDD